MNETALLLRQELNRAFLAKYPLEAARTLESENIRNLVDFLESQPPGEINVVFENLDQEVASDVLAAMSDQAAARLMTAVDPRPMASILARLDNQRREHLLGLINARMASELRSILNYPPDTAGHIMDPRFVAYRMDDTASDVVEKLQSFRSKRVLDVVLIDNQRHLAGLIPLQDILLAEPDTSLQKLAAGLSIPAVHSMTPRNEVVEMLSKGKLTTLPVVDLDGHVLGVIRHASLVQAVQEEVSSDLQTMMGVARDERALSSPWFSVRKRLPWLNINLLTAFLAAAVVGVFESTIARFTALAVLLPVVAGQSGNSGMQALAVTMRGLSLREIRPRHWLRILGKEAVVGAVDGLAIALVTMLGTFIWSRSLGLCAVIGAAMVLSMVIAGVAGASIPILLTLAKQDPAQSSSIILTTVTDVMGFLSFLGLATLFSQLL